jgi:hypothetical protein
MSCGIKRVLVVGNNQKSYGLRFGRNKGCGGKLDVVKKEMPSASTTGKIIFRVKVNMLIHKIQTFLLQSCKEVLGSCFL